MKTEIVLNLVLGASAEMTELSRILHPANCCQALVDAGLQNVYMPNNTLYSERVDSYWSLTSQLTPECFVQPQDTKEVAAVVEVLLQETQCPFAIRSGGHSSTAGANNIEKAVTIDLGLLNKTTYNSDDSIASVGPGARWLDVYRTLDEYNVGVLGGRIGIVGVGGLLLGGGCSLYLFRQGFATDNIAAFEVVLANSTIVTASAQENSDLFTALKGGGNNFGIVTRFDLMAFPASPIWSGSVTYPEGDDPSVHVAALKRWIDNVETYQNSSAVVFWAYRPQLKQTVIIKGMADVGGRPNPPIFDEFLSIPGNTSGSSAVTNMSTYAMGTQAAGYRNIWFSVTFKNDERVLTKAVELHHRLVEEMKADSPDGDFETQCFFQPLPSIVGKHGAEKGGNLLGSDRHTDNAVILLGSLAVNGQLQEAIGREKMMAWKRDIEDYSRSLDAQVEYYYMNYADGTQDVIGSYGDERVQMALDVARKYDPTGVFQKRVVGGFKLPDATKQV